MAPEDEKERGRRGKKERMNRRKTDRMKAG